MKPSAMQKSGQFFSGVSLLVGGMVWLVGSASAADPAAPSISQNDVPAAQARPAKVAQTVLEVWHGDVQRVGHLGQGQDDFNLMGHVEPWRQLDRLEWSLNQGGPVPLSFRAYRRLAADGDFNADVPIGMLEPGTNTLEVTAHFLDLKPITRTIAIIKKAGSCPFPCDIRWSDVKNPQDVGQYVDGWWKLEEDGLRTRQTGYDRLFLIGEQDWRDYEVRTSVRVHRVDPSTSPLSGGNGVGIIARFAGHVTGGDYIQWRCAMERRTGPWF